jgi:hypothetical protein
MRRHPVAVILAAALPLCGFGSCSKAEKPDLPKVVYVPVERTVAVPAALTSRCLEQCNSQLGAIEKLAPANEHKLVKP